MKKKMTEKNDIFLISLDEAVLTTTHNPCFRADCSSLITEKDHLNS